MLNPLLLPAAFLAVTIISGCGGKQEKIGRFGDAPGKVYVAPGKLDKYYEFCPVDSAVR